MNKTSEPSLEDDCQKAGDTVLRTRASKLWLGEDGILRAMNDPGAEISLADAQEIHAATKKLLGERKAPLLVDIRQMKSITREAREFFAGREVDSVVVAQALLVGSPVSRVVGNFFLGLNRTVHPTRLFSVESEALEWLRGFIKGDLDD